MQQYYETEAADHDVGNSLDGRVQRAASMFRRHLGSAQRLLDVGCGNGDIAGYLGATLGTEDLYGLEISEARAETARRRGLKVVQIDLNQDSLPFDDGFFEAIFCGELIEHMTDTDHLLEEIHRVLAPRGLCVLTTPNLAAWFNRLALLLGWQPFETSVSLRHEVGRPKPLVSDWGCRGHLQVFTFRALRELLVAHGFQIVDRAGVGLADIYGYRSWSDKPVRALAERTAHPIDALCSRFPSLASRLVVAMRKR